MEGPDVRAWLDRYVEAWRTYDRASIEALFTPDARYSFYPYEEPLVGARAIADEWLREPDEAGSWEASYRPQLIDGDRATAVGTTKYNDGRIYWNLWELDFAPDGRCQRFVEWFIRQPEKSADDA